MSIGSAILLGLIQGVAEFLPISSSGHLSVLQNFFHMQTAEDGHLLFDVLLHLGTLLAVFAAYWTDIQEIYRDSLQFVRDVRYHRPAPKKGYPGARLLLMMFFGTLPLAFVLPVKDLLESLYYKTWYIGVAFLLTGCMLYLSDQMPRGKKNGKTMTLVDALLVGVCQAVAVIPGISRSGSTITAGLSQGFERSFAVKYSLLLSIPAVLGANLLSLIDALKDGVNTAFLLPYLIGTLTAAVSGYFSIILLRRLLSQGGFGKKLRYYLWGMGALTLVLSLFL